MSGIYCEAHFNYVSDLGQVAITQPIRDGRAGEPTFEEFGFERLDHASAVADWRDEDEVNRVHAPEIDDLARAFSGCDVAVVYPTLVRSPEVAKTTPDYAPIMFVHSDFTDDYRRMVTEDGRPYRQFLDPLLEARGLSLADVRSASRMMMLQFWRNTGPVEADHPLAFCDARTVDEQRLLRFVVPSYGGQRLDFETFGVRRPPEGEPDGWYTFPQLRADEVVALRTYDSARDDAGRPFWTPHSAFRDPHVESTPEHRRQSVEMRALCLWS